MNRIDLFEDKGVKLFAVCLFCACSLAASCFYCEDANSFNMFWKNFAYAPLFVFSICFGNYFRIKHFSEYVKEKIYDSEEYEKLLKSFGQSTEEESKYEPFSQFVFFREVYFRLLLLTIVSIILSIGISNSLVSLIICIFCSYMLFVSIWFINACVNNDKALSYYDGIKSWKHSR